MAVVEIPCAASTIVATKDELAFRQVVDDFANAERITIVTFNVSSEKKSLLDQLSDLSAKITIICNIPKRFDRYYGHNVKQTKAAARNQICRYMAQLDPTRFGALVETYFSFRNHAKIIMTENVAFVGSANFSEESKGNWECGFVTCDPTAIAQLERVVEQIEQDSIRYLGHTTNRLFGPFATLQACASIEDRKVTEDDLDTISIVLEDLEDAIAKVDLPWAFGFEAGGPLTSRIDMARITALQTLIADSEPLREFAHFDPDDICVDDFPSDAYEEKLDIYLESASSENATRLEQLEEAARDDLGKLRTDLGVLCDQLRALLEDVTRAKSAIDNTTPRKGASK